MAESHRTQRQGEEELPGEFIGKRWKCATEANTLGSNRLVYVTESWEYSAAPELLLPSCQAWAPVLELHLNACQEYESPAGHCCSELIFLSYSGKEQAYGKFH